MVFSIVLFFANLVINFDNVAWVEPLLLQLTLKEGGKKIGLSNLPQTGDDLNQVIVPRLKDPSYIRSSCKFFFHAIVIA